MSNQNDESWSSEATSASPPGDEPTPPANARPTPPPDATVVIPSNPTAPGAAPGPAGPPPQAAPYSGQPPPPQPAANAASPSGAQPYGAQPYGTPAYGTPAYGVPGPGGAVGKRSAIGGALTMLIGALLTGAGTLLPWLRIDGFDFGDLPDGFDVYFFGNRSDQIEWNNPGAYVLATMAFVALIAIIVLAAGKSTATSVVGLLSTLVAGVVSLAAIGAVANVISEFDRLEFGPGIAFVALGAVVAFIGSILVAAKS